MFKRSHERKRNRLPHYNYSQPGYYFITICTHQFIPYFGSIKNKVMNLNGIGKIAKSCWERIPKHFEHVGLDEFIIMPNHFHGIITIEPSVVGDALLRPLLRNDRTKMLIPRIVHGFKSCVTRNIKKQYSQSTFKWQKSYYDHIIRDENGLEQIQYYIKSNPQNWKNDKNNPINYST